MDKLADISAFESVANARDAHGLPLNPQNWVVYEGSRIADVVDPVSGFGYRLTPMEDPTDGDKVFRCDIGAMPKYARPRHEIMFNRYLRAGQLEQLKEPHNRKGEWVLKTGKDVPPLDENTSSLPISSEEVQELGGCGTPGYTDLQLASMRDGVFDEEIHGYTPTIIGYLDRGRDYDFWHLPTVRQFEDWFLHKYWGDTGGLYEPPKGIYRPPTNEEILADKDNIPSALKIRAMY